MVVQAECAQDDDVDKREDADGEEDLVVDEYLAIDIGEPRGGPIRDKRTDNVKQK